MKKDRKDRRLLTVTIILVACIGIGIITVPNLNHFLESDEEIDWNLTLVGKEEKVIGFDEIQKMPTYEGYGGFFTTVGIKNGPYRCEGVPIEDLCDLVGGINPSDTLWVSAPDGYMMVFDYDQVMGNITTFHPDDLREVPHGKLTLILEYEQDGEILSVYDGKPLRLAVVSEDKLLTEGSYWVKWVDRIEIRSQSDNVKPKPADKKVDNDNPEDEIVVN